MAVYSKQVALATRLITAKGGTVAIRRYAEVAVDATKPWLGKTRTPTDTPAKAVALPRAPGSAWVRQGELDPRTSEVWLMSAEGISPKITLDNRLVRGSDEVLIVAYELYSPNGEDILYILQVVV
jgi:hypothetical protein